MKKHLLSLRARIARIINMIRSEDDLYDAQHHRSDDHEIKPNLGGPIT